MTVNSRIGIMNMETKSIPMKVKRLQPTKYFQTANSKSQWKTRIIAQAIVNNPNRDMRIRCLFFAWTRISAQRRTPAQKQYKRHQCTSSLIFPKLISTYVHSLAQNTVRCRHPNSDLMKFSLAGTVVVQKANVVSVSQNLLKCRIGIREQWSADCRAQSRRNSKVNSLPVPSISTTWSRGCSWVGGGSGGCGDDFCRPKTGDLWKDWPSTSDAKERR